MGKVQTWWYTSNLSTQEMKARGLGVQSHPQLHSKLDTSLGYMRPYHKRR